MFDFRAYIDFDGVINADKPRFDDVTTLDFKIKLGYGLVEIHTVTYSPTVLKAIEAMREKFNVEIVFLSTWNENMAILRVMSEMGYLSGARVINPVIDRVTKTNRAWTLWKADGIIADQKNDEVPFVWIDDEAIQFHKKNVDAATGSTPKLFVEPRGYWGLTASNISQMESFFKLHSK